MLTQKDRKRFRSIGHHLSPVVTISGNGLSDSVSAELSRAIDDHELIKIKVLTGDREERKQTLAAIAEKLEVEVIQAIGKIALIYKAASEPNPQLSNILRAGTL
ncbi:MAG: YhbY family RNA-binding protein [Pseudomonadales bacterium]|jgi:RNA-binding protein